MGTPGSGRYTIYLPTKTDKTDRLSKLFKGGFDGLYNGKENNSDAAKEAVIIAKSFLNGKGDKEMFGNGVDLSYGVTGGTTPDTTTVNWTKAGDPANAYFADLTSPGPGKTEGVEKDADPKILPSDIKPGFDSGNPSPNTASPSATSPRIGSISLGENLQVGKSSIE